MDRAQHNWAGNIAYGAERYAAPESLAELQQIVAGAGKVRAVGSRHSFNAIAATSGTQVSLSRLRRLLAIDKTAHTVTIEGGIAYGELSPLLEAEGVALRNLASLPHISVAGAVMTATHGSGLANGNLATAVKALKIVTASGEVVSLQRGETDFDGAVVSLGALGIVGEITLDVVPSFQVRQKVYFDLPFAALAEDFDTLAGSAYSVSFFTPWKGDVIGQVWLKSLAGTPDHGDEFFGARAAGRPSHPIIAMDPAPATEQLEIAGPWHDRLPHFRMDFLPSVGAELQSEYFVPREHARAALLALKSIQDVIAAPLLVSEIRAIAADQLWLSTAYGADTIAFHFTWKPDWPAVRPVLGAIEAALAPFGVRPHWGKLFTMDKAQIAPLWPKLPDFRALAGRLDPHGKFRNRFLDETLF